jgi:hypothetical protein
MSLFSIFCVYVSLTCQQRMLIPRRYLILPLVFLGVRLSPIFTIDYLMCLIWTHRFWLRIFSFTGWTHRFWLQNVPFRSPTVDTESDYWYHIWNGAHGGCDQSAGDAHSFATPDPAFAFVGGPCCPSLDFVIAFWIMIAFCTLLTSLFCIYYGLFH